MFIKWTSVLFISIGVIAVFALWSLLFAKESGTFTNLRRELIPEDRWLSGLSLKENQKFESVGEQISRKCLENLFGVEFKNSRLSAIKNPNTGKNLEIDCYNDELKIGLEYHGICHYKFIPFFHKTMEKFYESMARDEYKETMCKQLGIVLIIVPYNTSHDKICGFIKNELIRHGKLDHLTGWNDDKKKSR